MSTECMHEKASQVDGFRSYSYCLRCGLRIHFVMKGQFELITFQPCRENMKEPNNLREFETDCKCKDNIKVDEGFRIT